MSFFVVDFILKTFSFQPLFHVSCTLFSALVFNQILNIHVLVYCLHGTENIGVCREKYSMIFYGQCSKPFKIR